MPLLRSYRLLFVVAFVLFAPWLAAAVPAPPTQTPQRPSLAGRLLVAAPAMPDSRFARTVVLLAEHNQNGALGIIINVPVTVRPLADLLESLGEKGPAVLGSVRVFAGGPVQPEAGFVVHSTDYHGVGTIDINDQIALTSSRHILLDLGAGKGPRKSLLAFGYAGWGAAQLEGEIERGAWVTAPADAQIVFDEDREKVWESAFARRMQEL